MNILFLHNFDEMSGSFVSIMDSFLNLKNYFKCKCKVYYNDSKHVLHFKDYILQGIELLDISNLNYKDVSCDVLICSYSILKSSKIDITNILYNKLILLDSQTIINHFINKNYSTFNVLKKLHNYTILGNKFNSRFFKFNYKVYYHKFNEDRLNYIKTQNQTNNIIKTLSKEYLNRGYINLYPHTYKILHYTRHILIKDTPQVYFENIGKLIFEFLYFKKNVLYNIDNKSFTSDGLTEYLKIIGIDDSNSQYIDFNKVDLSGLFFNSNDLLITEI